MRRGVPAPLPPDQIKPLPQSVGIEEGRGSARPRLPAAPPEDFAIPELGQRKPSEKRNRPPSALRRFLQAINPGGTP